jgi:hypothetical protein
MTYVTHMNQETWRTSDNKSYDNRYITVLALHCSAVIYINLVGECDEILILYYLCTHNSLDGIDSIWAFLGLNIIQV